MKKPVPKKSLPDLDNADAAEAFRYWLATRIRSDPGSEQADAGPGRDSTARPVLDFPSEAWFLLSWVAEQGAEKLGRELTRAFHILFTGIDRLTHLLPHLQERYGDRFKTAVPFFEGLDEALAGIGGRVRDLAEFRAIVSRNSHLVMQEAFTHAGDPVRAEFFMRRYFELEPEEEALDAQDSGLIARLIRNACHSVEILERLEEKYPEAVAREAPYHDRWPVLRRRQDRVVRASPAGAVLGKHYPLDSDAVVHDARKGSLRSYLTPLVIWLSYNASFLERPGTERQEAAESVVKSRGNPWYLPFGQCPPLAAEVLISGSDLPPLRKGTAVLWADKLVVPFIMVTDAADLKALKEPALKAIWKQTRVKSVKTFRSRLLDAVRKELPRMARK